MNISLYIITVLIWGSTWFAISYQLGSVPLDVSIFYRFVLASFLIFLWCFLKRKNMKFSFNTHLFFMAQGFFLFSMNYIACYAANQYIASGLTALGFSMVLVFNVMNSFIFYRTPLTRPVIVGGLSGILGISCIFWPSLSTFDFSNESLLGILLSLLGGFLSSCGNMISARNQKKNIPITESNAFGMGYGALWMLSIVLFKGLPFEFEFSHTYIFSLVYLAIFGTIVAFGCYLALLGRIGTSKAAYAHVMTPLLALIISTFFEDFAWQPHIFAGMGLILFGNVVILARKSDKKNSEGKEIRTLTLKEAT